MRNSLELKRQAQQFLVAIGSAVVNAIALNDFLIPGKIFSAGINGIAQILALASQASGLPIGTGWFILLFNLPIGVLGWVKVGQSFTLYSIFVAGLTAGLSLIFPVVAVAHNALLAALFGGILTGVGVAYALKFGFSSGGMDIVAVVLQKTTGRTIGTLMLLINLAIILLAGGLFGWESALYTIISIYAMSRVVDSIHTRHQKLTAFIVTTQSTAVIDQLHQTLIRGITVIPSMGAYRRQTSTVLMVVISRYELYDLEHAVKETDPDAFVNLVSTVDIEGKFYDETEQLKARQQRQHEH